MKYKLFYLLLFFGCFIVSKTHACEKRKIKVGYCKTYEVEFTDLTTNKTFTEKITLKRKFGFANGFQKKIFWEYTPNKNSDSTIVEALYELAGQSSDDSSRREMLNSTYLFEKTGLIENRSMLWIHPPRSKYFRILEFTPFPSRSNNDSTYTDTITLGMGWGKYIGEKVVSSYTKREEEGKTIVTAEANSILGKVNSTFTVDETGFSKLEYSLFDRYKITFRML